MKLSCFLILSLLAKSYDNRELLYNKELILSQNVPLVHKYNQQNIALSKIKIKSNISDSIIFLRIADGNDIEFVISDLRKDGFNAYSYSGLVYIDLSGRDLYSVADAAIGFGKYYYVSEVFVSSNVYYEIFDLKNKSNFSKIYATRIGFVKGSLSSLPIDIVINKIEWTIKGEIGSKIVDIKIDHDLKIIKGNIGDLYLDLSFEWTKDKIKIFGLMAGKKVNYFVDWNKGVLNGLLNDKEIYLSFNMNEGIAGSNNVYLEGNLKNFPITLRFDKISGNLVGMIGESELSINLVNCDLYDFIQYIFVFLQ